MSTGNRKRSSQQRFGALIRSAEHGFTSFMRSAQQGFTLRKRSAEHGFTLIEMLVALAVFSLAALAMIRLQAVSVRTAADLSGRTGAQIVAENMRVEILTDPLMPAIGDSKGTAENGGRPYDWQRKVTPTGTPPLVLVTLIVEEQQGTHQRAVLSFLRAPR